MSSLSPDIQQKMMQILQIEEQKTDLNQLSVLSRVGMKVASATSSELDADSISASSTALIDLGIRLSNSVEHGALREILLHNDTGYGVLMAVNDEYIIFGALGNLVRIGYYMGYLREIAKKINAILSGGELTEMTINLQEDELKRMEENKLKAEMEKEKSIEEFKPSPQQDQAAMEATLAFLEDWGVEEDEEAAQGNIVSIPSSMMMNVQTEIKATPATQEAKSEAVSKAQDAELMYGVRVYDDEVPPIPLDDFVPLDVEDEFEPEEVTYEEPAVEEPVVEPEEVVSAEFPSMENFEPQFTDEFGAADEYDMDFEVEEDDLSDVLSELGWEEEDKE